MTLLPKHAYTLYHPERLCDNSRVVTQSPVPVAGLWRIRGQA